MLISQIVYLGGPYERFQVEVNSFVSNVWRSRRFGGIYYEPLHTCSMRSRQVPARYRTAFVGWFLSLDLVCLLLRCLGLMPFVMRDFLLEIANIIYFAFKIGFAP